MKRRFILTALVIIAAFGLFGCAAESNRAAQTADRYPQPIDPSTLSQDIYDELKD